jgi:hypothetical protein
MEHSGYLKAAESAITHVKGNVRYRGLNTAGGWIRNPAEAQQKVAARLDSVITGAIRSGQFHGGFDAENYINEMDRLAKDTNTGNCSELSAVAFNYLKGQGITPIDYFAVFRGGWNHSFVILNRDARIPVSDFAKWSYDAVVCDPLYDRAADAGFLGPWYPRMFPLKSADVLYRPR